MNTPNPDPDHTKVVEYPSQPPKSADESVNDVLGHVARRLVFALGLALVGFAIGSFIDRDSGGCMLIGAALLGLTIPIGRWLPR